MTDESYSFTAAKSRLDEIVTQVRKKDTSLEKSLDLLEEGVRLANVCTELIDHADWANTPAAAAQTASGGDDVESGSTASESADTDALADVDTDADADAGADADAPVPPAEDAGFVDGAPDEAIGDVWSEDEAWADETQDDPSDGDDGHGD